MGSELVCFLLAACIVALPLEVYITLDSQVYPFIGKWAFCFMPIVLRLYGFLTATILSFNRGTLANVIKKTKCFYM